MERPQVKIVDYQQQINQEVNVSQSEADYLLAKYGYKQGYVANQNLAPQNPASNQTFEDMIRYKESEKKRIEEEKSRRMNQPKSITFDARNIQYSQTKYSDLEIDNNKLGIKIQVVTDMKI
jgi:hypothetical protein